MTLTVCPSGCAFNRIQDAIAAANPGNTIAIGAGTYLENLTIDKNLTLQGTGQASTIINGRELARVVTIQPGRIVTIANVTIMNGFSHIDTFGDEEDGEVQTHQLFLPVMTR